MAQTTVNQLALVNLNHLAIEEVSTVCGWWDWFCLESSLRNRSKPFISLSKRIYHRWGEVGLFLKNNCPMNGPTYDSMALQNSNGDNHYWIEKRDGVWTVSAVFDNCKNVFNSSKIKDVADFLNEQKVPY